MTRDAAWYKWLTEVRRFKQCESCRTTRKENAVKKLHLPICSTVFRKSLRMSHFITLQAKFIFGEILLSKNYHEKFVKIAWCKNIQIHTIRKVKFLSKNTNIFTSFSHKIFLTIFFVKSKYCTDKLFKTTTGSRVVHQKNQSWIFGQKMKISNSVT